MAYKNDKKKWYTNKNIQIFFIKLFNIWCYIMVFFQKCYISFLEFILKWIPNKYILFTGNNNLPIDIIKATDFYGNDITNKLKLYINNQWNEYKLSNDEIDEICLNLEMFANFINTSIIWITYFLKNKSDLNNKMDLNNKTDLNNDIYYKNIHNNDYLIKTKMIDFKSNSYYDLQHLDVVKNKIMFGEIPF